MESETYYVRRQGRVQGPWGIDRLRSEVELRMLSTFHEVSTDGQEWMKASDLAGLFPKDERRRVLNRGGVAPLGTARYGTPTVQIDPAALDVGEWHYCVGENTVGPMSRAQLVEAVLSGRCPLDAFAWKEEFGEDWIPIDQLPELMSLIDAPRANGLGDSAGHTAFIDVRPSSTAFGLYGLVAGVVTLLFSWVPLLGFGGIIAIGLGGYALYELRKGGGGAGKGQAIAAILLGLASVGIAMLILMGVVVAVWMNR